MPMKTSPAQTALYYSLVLPVLLPLLLVFFGIMEGYVVI